MITTDSPKSKILIEPINHNMTMSQELIIHKSNLDRIEELEKKKLAENSWNSCCFKTDRRAVIYFSQFGLSVAVVIMCIYQLLTRDDCNSNQLFLGLLTLILGVYLPQPKIHK